MSPETVGLRDREDNESATAPPVTRSVLPETIEADEVEIAAVDAATVPMVATPVISDKEWV